MSLDVCVMRICDVFARMNEPDELKDRLALNYINRLIVPRNHPELKHEYVKYYFKAKQHYKEAHQ